MSERKKLFILFLLRVALCARAHEDGFNYTRRRQQENYVYLLVSRLLSRNKVFHVVPSTGRTDKNFNLKIFVNCSQINFPVNSRKSGAQMFTRFAQRTSKVRPIVFIQKRLVFTSISFSNLSRFSSASAERIEL